MEINKFKIKKVEALHKSIENSNSRTRSNHFITVFTCLLVLLVLFNSLCSWSRYFNFESMPGYARASEFIVPQHKYKDCDKNKTLQFNQDTLLIPQQVKKNRAPEVFKAKSNCAAKMDTIFTIQGAYYDQAITEKLVEIRWDKEWISIPILGLKCAVSDFSLLASVALMLLMVWGYYTGKTENQMVITLRETFRSTPDDTEDGRHFREYVLFGALHHFVFTPVSRADYLANDDDFEIGRGDQAFIVRFFIRLLNYMVPLTLTAILVSDVYTLYGLWPNITENVKLELVTREVICAFTIIATLVLSFRLDQLEQHTGKVLRKMFEACLRTQHAFNNGTKSKK